MKIRRMTYTKDGQRHQSEKFYAVFVDYSEALRRLPLFSDRKASEEAARKIDKLNQRRAAGDTLPPELTRFVESLPASIRDRLAEWGIIDPARVAAAKPLQEHVTDWEASLLAKGNTERHAELVASRARKIFDACGFVYWSDISASKLQSELAEMRKGERGIAAQTHNFYLQAAKQFCRWMVRDGRATESPLAHLQGLNVKTDRRRDRRPLSAEEIRRLLAAASSVGVRHGMSGPERALLYRLAVETGLRAGEIRSLTRASFDLDSSTPTVTIEAAYAKNRRRDTLPLRSDTAALLRQHLSDKLPSAPAFKVPSRRQVASMIRADLADARKAWLEEAVTPQERAEREASAFLAYRDDAGRVADFHALRHTFISNLAAGGVHPKTAQALARHSTITLTMDRYSHVYRGELASALDVLPDLSAPLTGRTAATGTHDQPIRLAASLPPKGGTGRSLMESGGVNRDDDADRLADIEMLAHRGNTRSDEGLEAVGVGFEPTIGTSPMPVFKTGPFNHSGTPPAR